MRKTFVVGASVLAIVAFGGSAAPAHAGQNCAFNYEQPFWAWGDPEWYGLAPGANFPSTSKPSGWTFSNASIVSGGNPHRPWSNSYSLYIKPGGYVITSAFCIDQLSPYSRMFAYTTTQNAAYAGGLKVELTYTDSATRKTVTKQVATLSQQGSWNATEAFPLVGGAVSPRWDSSGRTTAKYKFTAINGTAWRIDDLFIDPKRR